MSGGAFRGATSVLRRDGQKLERFEVVRGGRYAERPARIFTTGELRLDADMASLFDAARGADGGYPSRGFQRAALYREAFPWRVLARYLVCAAKKGADESTCLAIVDRLAVFVRDVFRKYGRRDQRAA